MGFTRWWGVVGLLGIVCASCGGKATRSYSSPDAGAAGDSAPGGAGSGGETAVSGDAGVGGSEAGAGGVADGDAGSGTEGGAAGLGEILGGNGGADIAGAAGTSGPSEGGAAGGETGRARTSDEDCEDPDPYCSPTGVCVECRIDPHCPDDAPECVDHECVCPITTEDLQGDINNCGACGNVCPVGDGEAACEAGECIVLSGIGGAAGSTGVAGAGGVAGDGGEGGSAGDGGAASSAPVLGTWRVSVDSDGLEAEVGSESSWPSISADGRFVAFYSDAANLVTGDSNGVRHVFVHDRDTGATTRVSVASDGTEGDTLAAAGFPTISPDGRFVAFTSSFTNLVVGDTNGAQVTFVHDRQTTTTARVSLSSVDVEGNGDSGLTQVTTDGRFVAFNSDATNLVEDDTNEASDIFVRDREAGTTIRISVSSDGTEANGPSWEPAMTPDGRFVAFSSTASNLVAGDTNDAFDVFLHDRQSAETIRVSVDSAGNQGTYSSLDSSISSDGQRIAYRSEAPDLVGNDTNGVMDIFVRDREAGETLRVSIGSGGEQITADADSPFISADGRFVAFCTTSENLSGSNVRQAFIHELDTETTTLVSVSTDGELASDTVHQVVLSADGTWVAFDSDAPNLVPFDFNTSKDVFVRRWR
jgi:Tol biopolymer transport system component